MPRYHFNVYDGRADMDVRGSDLPNIQAARSEALKIAGAILADAAHQAELGEEWRVEVTDDAGLMLFRLDLLVADAPAIHRSSKQ